MLDIIKIVFVKNKSVYQFLFFVVGLGLGLRFLVLFIVLVFLGIPEEMTFEIGVGLSAGAEAGMLPETGAATGVGSETGAAMGVGSEMGTAMGMGSEIWATTVMRYGRPDQWRQHTQNTHTNKTFVQHFVTTGNQ